MSKGSKSIGYAITTRVLFNDAKVARALNMDAIKDALFETVRTTIDDIEGVGLVVCNPIAFRPILADKEGFLYFNNITFKDNYGDKELVGISLVFGVEYTVQSIDSIKSELLCHVEDRVSEELERKHEIIVIGGFANTTPINKDTEGWLTFPSIIG